MNPGRAALHTVIIGIDLVLRFISFLVFAWVILSWLVFIAAHTSFRWKYRSAYNILLQLNQFFERAASPLVAPFRRLLPPYKTAGIDWSPLLLLLTVELMRIFIRLVFGPILM